MNRNTTKWQVEGNTVFKLKETGNVEKIDGKFVPEVTNDYLFNVQLQNRHIPTGAAANSTGPAMAYKAKFLAEHIANLLNKYPLGEIPKIEGE
jgi:hypothetical protein